MSSDIKSVSVRFSSQDKECSVTLNKNEMNTVCSTAHVYDKLTPTQLIKISEVIDNQIPADENTLFKVKIENPDSRAETQSLKINIEKPDSNEEKLDSNNLEINIEKPQTIKDGESSNLNFRKRDSSVSERTTLIAREDAIDPKIELEKTRSFSLLALNNSFALASSETLKNIKEDILKINDPLARKKASDLQNTIVYLKNWNEFLSNLLKRYYKIPFFRFRLIAISFLLGAYFVLPVFITGLLSGIYISFILFLYFCVSEQIPENLLSKQHVNEEPDVIFKVAQEMEKEENSNRIFKGWMNILKEKYNARTFRVNDIQSVLVRLDGNMLRISQPERAVFRHAFHTDPSLEGHDPKIIGQGIYDLTNAQIKLRPRRLARRRWFSRKYPICICLASNSHEKEGLNKYAIIEACEEEIADKVSLGKNSIGKDSAGKGSVGKGSLDRQSSKIPSINEEYSEAEIGQEADGYLSDESTASSEYELENDFCIQRSVSDQFLNTVKGHHSGFRRRNKTTVSDSNYQFYTHKHIYLFGRSAREKERWFHRLRRASNQYMLEVFEGTARSRTRRSSLPSFDRFLSNISRDFFLYILHNIQFEKDLEAIIDGNILRKNNTEYSANSIVYMDLGRSQWQQPTYQTNAEFITIVNLLATRILYDFCRDKYWIKAVQTQIQNKLATLHLPYFVETLDVSNFEIGTKIPKILNVYAATINEWGIWVDFEIKYEGEIKLMLETKLNLMKLKEQNDANQNDKSPEPIYPTLAKMAEMRCHYSDDEIPESPETSPDEEFGSKMNTDSPPRKKKGNKILRMVDKITQSNFFHGASELKPIRKMMEEISSTRLILNVEITELTGVMTINMPPPPSDRFWLGFRKPPKFAVKGFPQVGGRTVVLSTLSDWIEGKIQMLIEKNLVFPNLIDFVIPVLSGNELLSGPLNR